MSADYLDRHQPAEVVRDFIAGMTDQYFLDLCPECLRPGYMPNAEAEAESSRLVRLGSMPDAVWSEPRTYRSLRRQRTPDGL
ncbi:MAG: hypothetical protein MZV70_29010 [Desulfobacterales bacterium]|nr:hypothetical protein [Desulfobacterales bacterium]